MRSHSDHQHHSHGHGHTHGGTHGPGPGHAHVPTAFGRAFAIGTALNLALVIAELCFGFLANSLALISDGIHNFSDVLSLLLAWGAAVLARRRPTPSRTYGYRSASILAALGNAGLLLVATGAILVEAVKRLFETHPIASTTVIWVAGLGFVINMATALLFMRGYHHDLNVRGAFLHMVGDAAVSLGVVVSAMLIGWTGWLWLDPAVSIAVAVIILWSSSSLAREAFNLALAAVPAGIDRTAVEAFLAGLPGVTEVHDLHIWAMSTTETALTAHLVRPQPGGEDDLLRQAAHELAQRFGIQHPTLQIESGAHECHLAPAHVV